MKRVWGGCTILGAVLAVGVGLAFRSPVPPDPAGGAVRVLRGGSEVEVSGFLTTALALPLREALAQGAGTVQLDSSGGPPVAAEALAAEVKAAGASTAVTDRCLSACVAVFLAGRQRWVGPFSQLGLEARHVGESLLEFYRRAGVPSPLLRDVAVTPDGEGWFPTGADLLASGLATGLAAPDQFALAGFGAAPTVEGVRTRLLSVPLYRAAAAADPEAFEADLVAWCDAVLQGEPGTQAFDRTRFTIRQLIDRALPDAPGDMLQGYAAVLAAEIAWVRAHRPERCADVTHDGLGSLINDPELAQRRAELELRLLQGLNPVPRRRDPPLAERQRLEGCDTIEQAIEASGYGTASLRALARKL